MSRCSARIAVPTLQATVAIGFESPAHAALVEQCVNGRISGARLPDVTWESPVDHDADVHLRVRDVGHDLLVRFTGGIRTPEYRVDKAGFHWDFWKVFTALTIPQIVDRGVVGLHAATVTTGKTTVLLPGVSGAGKSSVAFAVLDAGGVVHASEMSFVRDGRLVAANSRMTIDPAALARFQVVQPAEREEIGGRVSVRLSPTRDEAAISRVVFPKVTGGPLLIRPISPRRARMLLYENALSQMPMAHLIAHETVPVGITSPAGHLRILAREVAAVIGIAPVIAEGRPQEIARWVAAAGS